MTVSRRTAIDPETGWIETWEREWGEGGWMLVSSSPPPPDPIGGRCDSCPRPGYHHGSACWVLHEESPDAE